MIAITKADLQTALQARFNRDYISGQFEVGTAVEYQCAIEDLANDTDALYAGSLVAYNTSGSIPAQLDLVATIDKAILSTDEKEYCAKNIIAVSGGVQLNTALFAKAELQNCKGQFAGYKYPITSYMLTEDGTALLMENGNKVIVQ
jgi:hypothetical protein